MLADVMPPEPVSGTRSAGERVRRARRHRGLTLEAVAVAGDILTPAQRQAVEALGDAWGGMYDIGGTRDGMYFARRDDGSGEALEAATPGELDAAMRADRRQP